MPLSKQNLLTITASAFLIFTVFATSSFAQTTQEQTEPAEQVESKISEILCRDVMLQPGIDRDTTLAFIHGYIAHKSGKDSLDIIEVEEATFAFIDHCVDNPKDNAIVMMEKFLAE